MTDSLQLIEELFPEIQELHHPFSPAYDYYISYLADLRFQNLKKISCRLFTNQASSEELVKGWQQFIENHRRLTHLDIHFETGNQTLLTPVFKHISHLNQLISLQIRSLNRFSKQLANCIEEVADNCLNLNSLSIDIFLDSSDVMPLMIEVKRFRRLKRLEMYFKYDNNSMTLRELFNDFQLLTHLSLRLYSRHCIKSQFFEEIDILLPNLKRLRQNYWPIRAKEETAHTLSRLPRLESLSLSVDNEAIRNLIVTKVMKNCPKIKSIDIQIEVF